MDEKLKQDILDCTAMIQNHMFKQIDAEESFKIAKSKYSENVISMAMKLLKKSRSVNPEFNKLSDIVVRCMKKVRKYAPSNIKNEDDFYNICQEAYKVFMNDEDGRAMPIVFLYQKGVNHLGVAPIIGSDKSSPMDRLKHIVYQADPDAYCFCGEGSSLAKPLDEISDIDNYKYGDIINNPKSKDVMIFQGNNKKGTKPFVRCYSISGETGNLEFKLIEEASDPSKVKSDKLP